MNINVLNLDVFSAKDVLVDNDGTFMYLDLGRITAADKTLRDSGYAVTAAQVQAAARSYLLRDNRTVGLFLPEDKTRRAEIPPACGSRCSPEPAGRASRNRPFSCRPGIEKIVWASSSSPTLITARAAGANNRRFDSKSARWPKP